MSVAITNENMPNNGMKEALNSCQESQISEVASGGCNQGTTKKTSLNACQENNVKVLGEEECEDLFENSMENIIFNEFSYK